VADTNANIIITVSAIVLTLSLGRIGDADLRDPAVLTLAAFTLSRWSLRDPRGAA